MEFLHFLYIDSSLLHMAAISSIVDMVKFIVSLNAIDINTQDAI